METGWNRGAGEIFRALLTGWALLLASPSSARSATITVDPAGGGNFIAIQPALDAAQDGDTVLVAPGEYPVAVRLNFNRLHDPNDPQSPPVKNLRLLSQGGPDATTIKASQPGTEAL